MSVRLLPRPGMVPEKIKKYLKVLLLCNSENSLTKRVGYELSERLVNVETVETSSPSVMLDAVSHFSPDIIICPFMKSRIPESIFEDPFRPCLIIHPGVAGDRGASSIDWSIFDDNKKWGVTVLQAEKELDSGSIWSTSEFSMDKHSIKTSIYVNEVADHAVACAIDSVSRFCQNISPTPLDYGNSEVWGSHRRNMKKADREVNWEMPAEEIIRRVRMSDTQPGAISTFKLSKAKTLRLFDAHEETGQCSSTFRDYLLRHRPGEPIAHKDGAVLFRAGDDRGVWIGRMKLHIKLSAMETLKAYPEYHNLPELPFYADFQEIKVRRAGPVCFIHFEFYNGAMDKFQAERLEAVIKKASTQDDVKVIALMGGTRFFSTGIHLCAIESKNNKAGEAWENINKIDDVILSISELKDKITVAVLQGNAGAGGAMLAAACDVVLAHPGSLITPTYKAMSLFGSEYWTYFLPRRVGPETAQKLVSSTSTLSAKHAQRLGLVDGLIGSERDKSEEYVKNYTKELMYNGTVERIIAEKKQSRDAKWFQKLAEHRGNELQEMKINFQQEAFLSAMKAFVHHLPVDDKQDLQARLSSK